MSTFVVHDVATVFLPLAERIHEVPTLRVRIFLNINCTLRDTALESELLRDFANQFDSLVRAKLVLRLTGV